MLWDPQLFSILTSKCASRHSGVQFLISPLTTWLRTRRFSEPTFRLTRHKNHWKNTAFGDFSNIWRGWIFFLLTFALLHLLSSDSTSSSDFTFLWLYFIYLLFLCFSTLHNVGSLLFKLPSIISWKRSVPSTQTTTFFLFQPLIFQGVPWIWPPPCTVTVEFVKFKFGSPDAKHVRILVVTGIQGGGHTKGVPLNHCGKATGSRPHSGWRRRVDLDSNGHGAPGSCSGDLMGCFWRATPGKNEETKTNNDVKVGEDFLQFIAILKKQYFFGVTQISVGEDLAIWLFLLLLRWIAQPLHCQLRNEKKPGCLGYVRDEILPNYMGIIWGLSWTMT